MVDKSVFDMNSMVLKSYISSVACDLSGIDYRKVCADDVVEIGYVNGQPLEVVVCDEDTACECSMEYEDWVELKRILGVDEHTHDVYQRINDYWDSLPSFSLGCVHENDLGKRYY